MRMIRVSPRWARSSKKTPKIENQEACELIGLCHCETRDHEPHDTQAVNNAVFVQKKFVPPANTPPYGFYKTCLVTALAFVPTVGPVLSGVTDIFLTYLIEANNVDSTMADYKEMCQLALKSSLNNYDELVIKSLYRACTLSFNDYRKHMDNLKVSPASEPLREALRIAFQNLENDIATKYIYSCMKEGYEAVELMMYTLFCTFHFVIYKSKFYKKMKTYTQWCKTIYWDGFGKVGNSGRGQDIFNNLTRFRNMMIQGVFDFVNCWYLMDPSMYGIGVTHDPCRYLFSPIIGTSKSDISLGQINQLITNNNYGYYKDELVKVEYRIYKDRMLSIQPFFYIDGTNTNKGVLIGGVTGDKPIVTVNFDHNKAPTWCDVYADLYPRRLLFETGQDIRSYSTPAFSVLNYAHVAEEREWYDKGGSGNAILGPNKMVFRMAGHKIGNLFGVSVNDAASYKTPISDKFPNGFVDTLIMAWIPEQIFHDNYVWDNVMTLIDAQKWTTRSTETNTLVQFKEDFWMPGVHAQWVPPNGFIQFNLKAKSTTVVKFSVSLRVHVEKATALKFITMTNLTSPATNPSSNMLLPVTDRGWFAPPTPIVINLTTCANYRLQAPADCGFHLQSLVFKPSA
eukprot:gene4962-5768_t